MQVAQKTHESSVIAPGQQHLRRAGLGASLRFDRIAGLVAGLEIAAVEYEVARVLPREDRIGLRAGGDQHGARGQGDVEFFSAALQARPARFHRQSAGVAELVEDDRGRREVLGEADPFLQCLLDFFVVQCV